MNKLYLILFCSFLGTGLIAGDSAPTTPRSHDSSGSQKSNKSSLSERMKRMGIDARDASAQALMDGPREVELTSPVDGSNFQEASAPAEAEEEKEPTCRETVKAFFSTTAGMSSGVLRAGGKEVGDFFRENGAIVNKAWHRAGKDIGQFNDQYTKPVFNKIGTVLWYANIVGHANRHIAKPLWQKLFKRHQGAENVVLTLGTVAAASAAANLISGTFNTEPFLLIGGKMIAHQGQSANPILFGGTVLALGLYPFYYLDWYLKIAYGWPVATGLSTMLPLAALEHLVFKAIKACGDKDIFQHFKAWFRNAASMTPNQRAKEMRGCVAEVEEVKKQLQETLARLEELKKCQLAAGIPLDEQVVNLKITDIPFGQPVVPTVAGAGQLDNFGAGLIEISSVTAVEPVKVTALTVEEERQIALRHLTGIGRLDQLRLLKEADLRQRRSAVASTVDSN